jgi:NAD(P)-dependent dehydrogenase (short-subunit alcohol dehydrogenase family)
MPNVLITGANRGLGLEFAKQYAEASWQVIACCRKPQEANELQELAQTFSNINIYKLDVAKALEIEALSLVLRDQALDVLINNAGLFGNSQTLDSLDDANWHEVFQTNAIAPVKMVQAFRQNLLASQKKLVVNITSKMGSIDDNTSGGYYIYRSSKVALNMVTKSLAVDLKAQNITVIALHPGWVETSMGGATAPTKPNESIQMMRTLIDKIDLNDSGKFFDYKGAIIPW